MANSTLIYLGIVIVLLFYPRKGLFAYLKDLRSYKEKVLLEDSLKHFLNMQLDGKSASFQSLAGALSISLNKSAKLIAELEISNYLSSQGGILILSSNGKEYALQVIRAHRLWESYLAEETGYSETEWHQRAEALEHNISPERMRAITDKLHNPSHDPHGDPIPTLSGDLGPQLGVPLTSLSEGDDARILHLEDEPESINKELVQKGLYPGLTLAVRNINSSEVQMVVAGKTISLPPVSAANITVEKIVNGNGYVEISGVPITELKIRQKAIVTEITHHVRGAERRRLMDMGLLPGTEIEAEMVSPSGDPTAYLIRGSLIALRKEQADHIFAAPIRE